MSWLEDHVRAGMSQVDTGPKWMKGRFGTTIYALAAATFILFGAVAGIKLLIDGPHKPIPVSDNSTESRTRNGAF